MKKATRIMALILTVLMVLSCFTASVLAAGSGSITVSGSADGSVSIANKKLTVYKIFDAQGNGVNTSYDWADETYKEFFKNFFSLTDAQIANVTNVVNKLVALKDQAAEMHHFAVELEKFIMDKNITATAEKTAGSEDTALIFDGLDYGYYLVTDSTEVATGDVLSGIMLTTTTGNADIQIKASKPTLNKTIYALTEAENTTWAQLKATNPTALNAKGASASLDQTVWYKLSILIPNTKEFHDGYLLRLTDSMVSGRTLTAEHMTVTVGENEIDISDYYDEDGTGTADDGYYFKGENYATSTGLASGVVFDTSVVYKDGALPAGAVAGQKVFPDNAIINLYYAAQLNNYFETSMTNTATLYYTNDPSKDAFANGNYTSVSSSATLYTNSIAISKRAAHTDGSVTTTTLAGAKFKIYRTDASQNRIGDALVFYKMTDEKGNPQYTLAADDTANANALQGLTGITPIDFASLTKESILTVHQAEEGYVDDTSTWADDTGTLLLYGLSSGHYEIEEVEAPAGYALPTSHFYLTVNNTYGPTTGVILGLDCLTGDDDANDGATLTFLSSSPEKQHAHLTLTNRPGDALPETGGMGTTLFTVLGIAMMVGAACFFTSKGGASKKQLS